MPTDLEEASASNVGFSNWADPADVQRISDSLIQTISAENFGTYNVIHVDFSRYVKIRGKVPCLNGSLPYLTKDGDVISVVMTDNRGDYTTIRSPTSLTDGKNTCFSC